MCIELADKRIYLSGPMTGIYDWNRESFSEAARYLRYQGAKVFNPAFSAPAANKTARPHSFYMIRDLHELTSYIGDSPYYDALALLPGWDKSNGAKLEKLVAKACGIDVFTI